MPAENGSCSVNHPAPYTDFQISNVLSVIAVEIRLPGTTSFKFTTSTSIVSPLLPHQCWMRHTLSYPSAVHRLDIQWSISRLALSHWGSANRSAGKYVPPLVSVSCQYMLLSSAPTWIVDSDGGAPTPTVPLTHCRASFNTTDGPSDRKPNRREYFIKMGCATGLLIKSITSSTASSHDLTVPLGAALFAIKKST